MALIERLNALEKEVVQRNAELITMVTDNAEALEKEMAVKVEGLKKAMAEFNEIAEAINKVKDLTSGL
jgi:hypothetical protein